MKLYFLDGTEEWCSIATMLGWDAVVLSGGACILDDSTNSVVFLPEYVPVSQIRMFIKNAHIVVVWRDYKLGVIENIEHTFNVVTDKNLIEKVNNATFVPESIHEIFSILRTVSSSERVKTVSDSELENKTLFERAHLFKNVKTYTGKKFLKEAYVSGCDVVSDDVPIIATRCSVARHLNDFLNKLMIFLSINDSVPAQV